MSERLLDRAQQPTPVVVAEWIGERNFSRWTQLLDFIASHYPGVFEGEWLFGGKHGWSLRFKKSRSFCTLIPEREHFKVVIVFGRAEREKAEAVLPALASHVRDDYEQSTTYHDGKWVLVDVDDDGVLRDVERLLEIKRRPAP